MKGEHMYHHKQQKRKKMKWRKRQKSQNRNRYATFVKKLEEEKQLDIMATAYWEEVVPLLKTMQSEIIALGKPPGYNQTKDNMIYCVNIFDIVSRYQDQLDGSLKVAPGEKAEAADAFNNDLFYAGRHTAQEIRPDEYLGNVPYWNTTNKGEPITTDNICFGPELGLPRKPASYWLSLSKKKKVEVNAVQEFEKGSISRTKELWAAEALVKIGINHFNKTAYKAFTTELDALLA